MAGSKLSPRQKMINLMYLVLLALLAMQVSVEVMEAFSKMYERFEDAIETGFQKNKATLDNLKQLSVENPTQYSEVFDTAKKVEALSKDFIAEIDVLKNIIKQANPLDPETDRLPAESMGKGDLMDEYLFTGDKSNANGQKFVEAVDTYHKGMVTLLSNNNSILREIDVDFNTKPVMVDGVEKSWLDYNFKGIPTIGTIAILSSMQNTVLNIENEALSNFVSGRLKQATSATQLQAFVKLNKNTYSPGDEVSAEIFLASKDDTKVPSKVEINGENIDLDSDFIGGKVLYKFKAGAVGDQPIVGQFIFTENGEEVPIAITSNYSVVAGSNQAIISADKMNVVYRGVVNPITISLPGISPNKLKVTGYGLTRKKGSSYELRPGSGRTVSIGVTGTSDSGEIVKSPPVLFRIKDIPSPMASIRGEYNSVRMPKTSLMKSTVAAGLPDFDFDLKLKVLSFKIKVPGKPTLIVNGRKMNAQAQKIIGTAKKGDIVNIFGIRAGIVGNSSYKLKEVLPISVEISN